MIQVGSKVRVVRPGRFEFRGEVVDMVPARFDTRRMVKIRPDPDQFTTVAAKGRLNRWVELVECIEEEPVVPASPDAPLPRPGRADADALRILSDQLEELGLDAGAALLRDVAGRIEHFDETYRATTAWQRAVNATTRSILDDFGAMPPGGDFPG